MRQNLSDLREAFLDGQVSRRQFVIRALGLGLSVSAAAEFLAACESASPTAPSGKLSGNVQILVGYFGTGNAPAQLPVQEALAAAFMKQHPEVKIEFLRLPFAEARTKLVTLVGAGTPPDLVLPTGIYGASLVLDKGMWLDLGKYFRRDGISLEKFAPEVNFAVHAPNYYGQGSNAIIGVPVGIHNHVIAYNADLFQKAGIAPPPSSWDDTTWTYEGKFLETAKALTVDKNGKHPGDSGFDPANTVQFGLGHYFRESVWIASGGRYYDATTKRAQFDTPESIQGIQLAADLVNKHKVQPSETQVAQLGAGAEKGNEEQFAWKSGKLAMIDMCSCDIKGGFGSATFNWQAAALPAGKKRRFGFLNLDIGAIVKSSKNQDTSWEVLKFFAVDPANERKLAYDSYGAFPPLKQNTDAFVEGVKKDLPKVEPAVWRNGIPYSGSDNEAWFPAFAQVNDLVGPAFDKIMSGAPAEPIMKALQQQAQAKIDDWFKQNKLPT